MRRKIYKAEDEGNADPNKQQQTDNGEAFGRSAGWQAAGSIATSIGQAFRPTNSADQTASAIGQGIGDAVSQIHPIAAIAVAAGRIMDSALGDSG